jgi:predicted nucleotidyltransferase component of viral defense system
MYEYNGKVIGAQAAMLDFIRDTFEKVIHIVDVLVFLERDPVLSKCLALKGGTAINLAIFNMPRLSVDIDLDFAENLPLEGTMLKRKIIAQTIDRFMTMRKYSLNELRSKHYHALDSYVYKYINTAGVNDNIKIEINYSLRSHILPFVLLPVETLGIFAPVKVLSLAPVEIFAAKIVALFSRAAARDLYDVNGMIEQRLFDESMSATLRKSVVFYAAISGANMASLFDYSNLDALTEHDMKTGLAPMLRKKEKFNLSEGRERVKKYFSTLLAANDSERQFLTLFQAGEYRPELLFDGEMLERVRNHPMAVWKMRQSKRMAGNMAIDRE